MTAWARFGRSLLVALVAAFALAGIVLLFIFQSAPFRNWIQGELSQRSGWAIRMAKLSLRPPFGVVAESVEVSKAGEFLFRARRVSATVSPFVPWLRTLRRLDIEDPVLEVDMAKILKKPTESSPQFALRRLSVQHGTMILKNGETTILELPNVNLAAENLNLGRQGGVSLRADVPWLKGEAELEVTGQRPNLETQLVVRPKQNQSLLAGQKQKTALPELLRVRAALHAPEERNAEATIAAKFEHLPAGRANLTGRLDGRAEIDAGWARITFTGRAALSELFEATRLAGPRLPPGQATADFAGSFSPSKKMLSLSSVEFRSALASGAAEGEVIFEPAPFISKGKINLRAVSLEHLKAFFPEPLERWTYQGQSQVDLEMQGPVDGLTVKGLARSDGLRIRGENLQIAALTLAAPFEWAEQALQIREAKFTATQIGLGAKNRWQTSAERLQISASLSFRSGALVKLGGRLEAYGGKFASPDNTKAGENLTFRGPFELALSPTQRIANVKGNLTAENGEILWGKFFAELKAQRPELIVDGDYFAGQKRVECRRCSLHLAAVGAIDLAGSVERLDEIPVLRAQAASANFSPGAFFDFFLKENFKRQYPLLEKLGLGGRMAFRSDLRGPLDQLIAEGEVSLESAEVRVDPNGWRLAPITLNLPFLIHLGEAPGVAGVGARNGSLSIGNLWFGKQSTGPLGATISLFNNTLRLLRPIRLQLFGGEIAIANLFWPDLVHDPERVSFSAELKGLQLEELTAALNWHRFSGTLTGSIPKVESSATLLRAGGEMRAELFGGRMRIGQLEIENPFSPLASIKLDAQINDLELEKLSSTFQFGRISGILEGSVEDLVLTAGQPAELRAEFHSVERPGTEQRISVEAIDKITVLSSGQSAGALYSGLAGFFDSFRYSKLGFKAALKNDTLTLRGVETRGDQEFLVVGSFFPPTVNIISHTQHIAFSELLRRLQRIKSGGSNVQ